MRIYIPIIMLSTIGFTQQLDKMDIAIQKFEKILIDASRASQRVLVEDFTGLQ